MGSTETTVNGLLAAQNKDGLTLLDRGSAVGKIIVHKATVAGQPSSQEKSLGSSGSSMSNAPVIVQPSAPPVIIANATVVEGVRSMSIKEPMRPLPVPSSPAPPTFIDYIKGGCEINLTVAIDFTGSNGDPRVPGTLHYRSDGLKNDYEKAILAVGNILSNFDTDKKFPVW